MRITIGLAAAAVLTLTMAGSVQAACRWTPGIGRAQVRQQARIAQGVRSRELTRCEARRLEGQERALERAKLAARADGRIRPAERRLLRADVRETSRDIYRAKHNRWVR